MCIGYDPPSIMTTIVQNGYSGDLSKFDESEKFTFVWKNINTRSGELVSEEFTIKGPGGKISSWSVKFNFFYYNSSEGKVNVVLQNLSDEDFLINCTVSSLDPKKKKHIHVRWEKYKVKSKSSIFHRNLFESPGHLNNGPLTLIFEIAVLGATKKSVGVVNQHSIEEVLDHSVTNDALSKHYHQGQLSQDLGLLFTSNEYADITIVCGDEKFKCHKNILASRSPVFKTMFDADMKEKEAGSVEIKNMTPEVLENMLKYIYTSEAPDIDTLTEDLFAAAEQYQLEKLKELCEAKLCSKIEVANCIEILVLADLYQATTLKVTALKFVADNIGNMDASEWKKTLIAYPNLLVEVMEMIIPNNN